MAGRRMGRGAIAATLAAVVGLSACVGAIDRRDFDAEVQRRGGGVISDLIAGPLQLLRTELGVDDPELLSVAIVPVSRVVTIEVRDPTQRRNVDRYVSRNGGLSRGEPVRISASDDLDARTFRASEVAAFDDLEGLADTAIEELGFDDAYVSSISSGLRDGAPVLTVLVSSPRATGAATFDATGRLLSVRPS